LDRGGEAGSTGFGRPIGPVRAASTGPALPAQPARSADSTGWGRLYRRPRAGPAGPRDPSGRPLAGSTVTGPRPPRPDDGAIPSRSLRALFASPIRRRGRTKNSAARVLLPHNVQVATVTPDYSGPQYIATSLSSRTLSRPEPAHAHLCTTLSTPLPRCAVCTSAHGNYPPNHATAPQRKRKNVATQTQHQVTMLTCALGERVQERASSVHW